MSMGRFCVLGTNALQRSTMKYLSPTFKPHTNPPAERDGARGAPIRSHMLPKETMERYHHTLKSLPSPPPGHTSTNNPRVDAYIAAIQEDQKKKMPGYRFGPLKSTAIRHGCLEEPWLDPGRNRERLPSDLEIYLPDTQAEWEELERAYRMAKRRKLSDMDLDTPPLAGAVDPQNPSKFSFEEVDTTIAMNTMRRPMLEPSFDMSAFAPANHSTPRREIDHPSLGPHSFRPVTPPSIQQLASPPDSGLGVPVIEEPMSPSRSTGTSASFFTSRSELADQPRTPPQESVTPPQPQPRLAKHSSLLITPTKRSSQLSRSETMPSMLPTPVATPSSRPFSDPRALLDSLPRMDELMTQRANRRRQMKLNSSQRASTPTPSQRFPVPQAAPSPSKSTQDPTAGESMSTSRYLYGSPERSPMRDVEPMEPMQVSSYEMELEGEQQTLDRNKPVGHMHHPKTTAFDLSSSQSDIFGVAPGSQEGPYNSKFSFSQEATSIGNILDRDVGIFGDYAEEGFYASRNGAHVGGLNEYMNPDPYAESSL